jgi:hypothetical protein
MLRLKAKHLVHFGKRQELETQIDPVLQIHEHRHRCATRTISRFTTVDGLWRGVLDRLTYEVGDDEMRRSWDKAQACCIAQMYEH